MEPERPGRPATSRLRGREAPELGRDPLDPVTTVSPWAQLFPARRAVLGIAPSAAPSIAFILLGAVLGPGGLSVLSPEALLRLGPVVSIALAALGVFVGLGLGASLRRGMGRLFAASLAEGTTTIAVVAPALFLLLSVWAIPIAEPAWLFATIAAVCSSASAASAVRTGPLGRIARIVDLDDGPLVLWGSLVVALASGQPVARGLLLTVAAGLGVGLAGWLLFERARSVAERGVFVAGAVALLGGVAAYAWMSPLLSGVVAALVWVWSPGGADRLIAGDLRKLQHPLIALLLIAAGASIQWSHLLLWVAAPLLLLRLVGKLQASLVAARIVRVNPGLLATVLLPPGVLGVAIAVNVQMVSGSPDTLLLSAVTVATGISEVLAAFLLPGDAERAS